ncbi:hypothetical protein STRTUCAR8_01096 [Streptomyces turgidiscabies Car8]|uniref:Uncharacterized protein n=1 Tax=Streptomyces turgidiscabies (strain Car8) TaxID=698760 RepID=L7FH75_STRT8|nr:hypothetical protein STRTUCAR8_01096 [Streptomyces turgidiscabies Car8]GAQ71370.1 hypothetical protein T45_03112 [Streptomyces turgidiscabies]
MKCQEGSVRLKFAEPAVHPVQDTGPRLKALTRTRFRTGAPSSPG